MSFTGLRWVETHGRPDGLEEKRLSQKDVLLGRACLLRHIIKQLK